LAGDLGRLLILDDDPGVARLVERAARTARFDVRAAIGPDEFFELLDAWLPTHVALDLIMPGMDGIEVIEEMGRRRCPARLIITSGVGPRVLDAAGRSAVEHGLDIAGVLAKPFTMAAFRRILGAEGTGRMSTIHPGTGATGSITALDVRDAVASGAFSLAYQPKVFCSTGAVLGFEALVRWDHPTLGPVGPDVFLPIAEQEGCMAEVTDQVVRAALAWAARLPDDSMQIAVNLSPGTMTLTDGTEAPDTQLADDLADRCAAEGIDPARVVLELTETSAMSDPVAALATLTRLRMKGFLISMDDFGTGFSSMLQLVRMPFSELKIDRSFVRTALRSSESRAVIQSAITLAHALGLQAVAEGVEEAEVLELLRDQGCDLAQGYLIARPMAGPEALAWLDAR
jgi:EAL domain-containing protein (putative c-di-GMP-specific phosphodiesterase class I)/ActR/RegA family two-component response regulator